MFQKFFQKVKKKGMIKNREKGIGLECLEDRFCPAIDFGTVSLSPLSDIVSQHKTQFSLNYEKAIHLPDLSFSINFGDGLSQEEIFPAPGTSSLIISHTYPNPGEFNVSIETKTSDIAIQNFFDNKTIDVNTVGLINNPNGDGSKIWGIGGTGRDDSIKIDSKDGNFIAATINGKIVTFNPNPQPYDDKPDREISIKTGDGNDFVALGVSQPNGFDRIIIHDVVSGLESKAVVDMGSGNDVFRVISIGRVGTPRAGREGNLDFQFVNLGSYYGRPNTYTDNFFIQSSNAESVSVGKTPFDGSVALLYQTLLNRAPSAKEVSLWASQIFLKGYDFVAKKIFYSYESSYNIVNEWYKLYLHRQFSNQEASYWINQLMARQSRESLLAKFLSSPEYLQIQAPGNGRDQKVLFVKSLYQNLLERDPTVQEIDQQIPAIGTPKDLESLAKLFLGCSEYREKEIRKDFQKFLNRGNGLGFPNLNPFFTQSATPGEVKAWSILPLSLTEIHYRFVTSPDFTRFLG